MNSHASAYDIQITPATVATNAAIFCGLMSMFCNQPLASTPAMEQTGMHSYTVIESGRTHGQFPNNLLGVYEPSSVTFESFMSSFYNDLLIKQESLGKDFEHALYENLWSLYVRS